MTHLSLELCQQLKAAGFPQDDSDYFRFADDTLMVARESGKRYPRGPHQLACPNSDELIAAIQAEWPDDLIEFGYLYESPSKGWAVSCCNKHNELRQVQAEGATLTEALANLYIALKEQ